MIAAKPHKRRRTLIFEITPIESVIETKVNRLWIDEHEVPVEGRTHEQWLILLSGQGWTVVSANKSVIKSLIRIIYELKYDELTSDN